jgi:hypothetical protein
LHLLLLHLLLLHLLWRRSLHLLWWWSLHLLRRRGSARAVPRRRRALRGGHGAASHRGHHRAALGGPLAHGVRARTWAVARLRRTIGTLTRRRTRALLHRHGLPTRARGRSLLGREAARTRRGSLLGREATRRRRPLLRRESARAWRRPGTAL